MSVSNVTFLFHFIETTAGFHLNKHLVINSIINHYSLQIKWHSTKIALIRVIFFSIISNHQGKLLLIVLSDLSAGFDMFDQKEVFSKLFVLSGKIDEWFRSYLESNFLFRYFIRCSVIVILVLWFSQGTPVLLGSLCSYMGLNITCMLLRYRCMYISLDHN